MVFTKTDRFSSFGQRSSPMKIRTRFVLPLFLLCTSIVSAQPQQQPSSGAQQAAQADQKKPATPEKAEPPKDKAFADIVKDAQVIKGLFTLYRTEEKVFLEIMPEQLDKIYLVSL